MQRRRLERARHHHQQRKNRIGAVVEERQQQAGVPADVGENTPPAPAPENADPVNNDGFSLTGPITITVFVPPSPATTAPPVTTDTPPPPATTTNLPPPATTSSPPPPPPTTSSTTTAAQSPTTVLPSVSVSSASPNGGSGNGNGNNGTNNNGNNGNNGNGNSTGQLPANGALSQSSRLSTGAIVGIVIAILVVLSGAAVFFLRRKNVFARKRRRATWLAKGGIMGPKPISGYDTFLPTTEKPPPPAPPVPANNGYDYAPQFNTQQNVGIAMGGAPFNDAAPGELSPGVAFARAQDRALQGIAVPQASGYPMAGGAGATTTGGAAAAAALASLAQPPQSYLNNNNTNTIVSTAPSSYGPVSPPPLGESATVVCTFIPSLPDELNIGMGEVVTILQSFDDGWTQCVNSRGEQGMVPLECLDRSAGYRAASGQQVDSREYRRASSLASGSVAQGGAPPLAPNRLYS